MKFHDQYQDSFDNMSTASKLDMLQILATWDDEGSKLKGQRLLDQASEYVVLLDGGFTPENVSKLRKYHSFITKFNKAWDAVLDEIVWERILLIRIEWEQARIEWEQARIEWEQSDKRLEKLISLRKQMELIAYNHSS
jgi:adenylate kinase family enzyme